MPRHEGSGICAAGYSVTLGLSARRLLSAVSERFFWLAPARLAMPDYARSFHLAGLARDRRQLAVAHGPGRNGDSVARFCFGPIAEPRAAPAIERAERALVVIGGRTCYVLAGGRVTAKLDLPQFSCDAVRAVERRKEPSSNHRSEHPGRVARSSSCPPHSWNSMAWQAQPQLRLRSHNSSSLLRTHARTIRRGSSRRSPDTFSRFQF